MAPVVRGSKGEYRQVFEDARRAGYIRVRMDGTITICQRTSRWKSTSSTTSTSSSIGWCFQPQMPMPVSDMSDRTRLADSLEMALKLGRGFVMVQDLDRPN